MSDKLLEELKGWTIDDWNDLRWESAFSKIFISKDGKQRVVYVGSGEGTPFIEQIKKIYNGKELYTDLETMVEEIYNHGIDSHGKDWTKKPLEPIDSKNCDLDDYLLQFVSCLGFVNDKIKKIYRMKSIDENKINLICIDESVWYKMDDPASREAYGESGLFSSIQFKNDFYIVMIFVHPDDLLTILNNKHQLPEEIVPSNWDTTKTIKIYDNPHYVSFGEEDLISQNRIKADADVKNLLFGFICTDCNREWSMSLEDVKRSDNEKLRQLMQTIEGREQIARGDRGIEMEDDEE
jgi:hypothetical protein